MNILTYADPGTTAAVVQLVVGIFIVTSVVIGIWWTKITTFIKTVWVKIFAKKKEEDKTKITDESAEEEL